MDIQYNEIGWSASGLKLIGAQIQEGGVLFTLVNATDAPYYDVKLQVTFIDQEGQDMGPAWFAENPKTLYARGERVEWFFAKPIIQGADGLRARIWFYTDNKGVHHEVSEEGMAYYPVEYITEVQRRKLQEEYGEDVWTYAEKFEDAWRCSCGVLNEEDSADCIQCGRNGRIVLRNQTRRAVQSGMVGQAPKFGENIQLAKGMMQRRHSEEERRRLAQAERTAEAAREEADRIRMEHEQELQKAFQERDQIEKAAKKREEQLAREVEMHKTVESGAAYWISLPLWKKMGMVIMAGALVAAIIFAGRHYYRTHVWEDTVAEADELITTKDYDRAISLYYQAINIDDTPELQEKIESANILRNSQEAFDNGENYYGLEDWISAVREYLKVAPIDQLNYEKAQTQLVDLETKVMEKAEALTAEFDFGGASLLISNYLIAKPEDERATQMAQTIKEAQAAKAEADRIAAEEQQKALEEAQKAAEEAEAKAKAAEERAALQKKADSLTSKLQTIDGGATVYQTPSGNAAKLGNAPNGATAYVYETQIYSTTIWAKVRTQVTDKNAPGGTIQVTGWIRASNLK